MILPGRGIVRETITCFARKNVFGDAADPKAEKTGPGTLRRPGKGRTAEAICEADGNTVRINLGAPRGAPGLPRAPFRQWTVAPATASG